MPAPWLRTTALAALLIGCDLGDRDDAPAQGPPLHLVAVTPAADEGLECTVDSPGDCGVVPDARIELRFDRFLDPATAAAEAVLVTYTGISDAYVQMEAHYDLVERVLVLSLPLGHQWWRGIRYGVRILVPDDEGAFGLRAFDGAALSETGSVPLEWSFRVRWGDPEPRPEPPAKPTCADVRDRFARAGCQSAVCHQPASLGNCPPGYARADPDDDCVGVPRMGLDLSSSDGLLATAIDQVAHQAETGPGMGTPLENPDRFGVQMPVLDPGRPANSYLMYKLLRNRAIWSGSACESRFTVPLAGECPTPSQAQLDRLREWFVRGEPMPPFGSGGLTRSDLELVHSWISFGAPMQDCE